MFSSGYPAVLQRLPGNIAFMLYAPLVSADLPCKAKPPDADAIDVGIRQDPGAH